MWQSSALVSPREKLNNDLTPFGDDIEPIGVPREDVAMSSARARWNPKNPPVERNITKKIMDVLSSEVDVLLLSKVVESFDSSELHGWMKKREK